MSAYVGSSKNLKDLKDLPRQGLSVRPLRCSKAAWKTDVPAPWERRAHAPVPPFWAPFPSPRSRFPIPCLVALRLFFQGSVFTKVNFMVAIKVHQARNL